MICVRSTGSKNCWPGPTGRPLSGGCSARRNKRPWNLPCPCRPAGPGQRLAGRAAANFAAKEAFLKAAGTGLSGPFALREIQALRLPSGQPEYQFCGGSAQWMAQHQLQARLSLSHDGGMALAFCTLEPCGETCPARRIQ